MSSRCAGESGHQITRLRVHGIDPNRSFDDFGVEPRDFPGSVALETNPGDLVVFNHDIYHASFGGSSKRRMFTMNLIKHAESEADRQDVRSYVTRHSPGGHKQIVGAGMYSTIMLATAGPERMTHLSELKTIHDEIYPALADSHRR